MKEINGLDPQTIHAIQLLKPQLEGLVNNLNWDHLFSKGKYPQMDVKRVIQVGSSLKNVGFDLADNLSFMKNLHKIVVNEIDPVTLKKLEEAGVLDLSVEFFEKLFTVNGKYEAENCMFKGVDIDTPEGQGVMERVFEFRKSFPKACKAMENIEKELALPKLKPRF